MRYDESIAVGGKDTPLDMLYTKVCKPSKGKVFEPFWSKIGYRCQPFWPENGYGFYSCRYKSKIPHQKFRGELLPPWEGRGEVARINSRPTVTV